MARGKITVEVVTDAQVAYDDAKAIMAAWQAFAERLRTLGRVCDHPDADRVQMIGAPDMCTACGYAVPGTDAVGPLQEGEGGND